jgi:hypothetical protein
MTMRVNLIHSKLVFFFKNTKTKHAEKKKVHSNSASELHCARKHRISKSSYELLCQIHVQKRNLHGTHQN